VSRSDWIAIAVTLICILFSDVLGGHKAAIICGVVGLAILIILRVREAKTSDRTSEEHANVNPEDINPDDLLALFEGRTEIQAQIYVRRWIGKRVRVKEPLGEVSHGLSISPSIYVALVGGSGIHNCFFWIPKTRLNDFAHIQQGTEITVEGTIKSVEVMSIQLEKVKLVKIGDQAV
jgi:hypothetical protein